MKKFLILLSVFVLIMFITGLVKLAVYPNRNYSSPTLNAKLEYLEKHPEYNMYFIGSSRINNQIDCHLIDDKIKGVKSYNLGANAGFDLENFQMLEYILEHPSFNPRYIVLELQDRTKITKVNLKTERSFGVFNYKNTVFAVKSQKENNNHKQIALSLVSFVINVFHFNKSMDERAVRKAHHYSTDHNQGFFPLDSTGFARTEKAELDSAVQKRLTRYLADHKQYKPNSIIVKKINDLSEQCKKKNIQLIMLIPGPAEAEGKKLLAYRNVLDVPVISLLDPYVYPEFYIYENRWDYGHLNEKGAKILSLKLVPFLEKIIK